VYAEGFYVFIDARKKDLYEDGHIPGAYHFDPWRLDQYPEGYVEEIIKKCMAAGKVVCYCEGDDCEDSERAAGELSEHDIDYSSLYVYIAGYHEWIKNMQFEKGERNSGEIMGGSDE
ncbi:MAG: rhodanese-like domain-containing protein, partial [Planctomycetota bacterium]